MISNFWSVIGCIYQRIRLLSTAILGDTALIIDKFYLVA